MKRTCEREGGSDRRVDELVSRDDIALGRDHVGRRGGGRLGNDHDELLEKCCWKIPLDLRILTRCDLSHPFLSLIGDHSYFSRRTCASVFDLRCERARTDETDVDACLVSVGSI